MGDMHKTNSCARPSIVWSCARAGRGVGLVWVLLAWLAAGWVQADPVVTCQYGKTELVFPDDPLERREYIGGSNLGWVKFTLLTEPYDSNVVYFQDSNQYPLHYDFASQCLGPFEGIDPAEFDRITLHAEDQQMILGAVVTPPTGYGVSAPIQEYGIQFVRRDPFTREEIASLFHKVVASITSDPNVQPYYFPTFEQSEVAQSNVEWFQAQGIPISSAARWLRGNTIYSEGWAVGRLRYVAGRNINAAYASGQLLADDILLTDAVPAEIPVLAGVITLSPSTPNSHVAILSNTYGIPFVHLAEAIDRDNALALDGRRVVLRAYARYEQAGVYLVDANDTMTDDQAADLVRLKAPPALDIQAIERFGQYSASVESLGPEDIRYFGGKAANYSILRRAIPDNSRVAMAFSFDLWSDFLDQRLPGGQTLRAEIDDRLSGYTFPPVSAAALEFELDQIRELIKDDDATVFSPALEEAVLSALTDPVHGFDPNRKIRFRSSTNVEDSEHFSGAGLYDSYSGCLADDLDGDDSGPSICDPTRSKERGVFRAIRKVFASFYNYNAYLERLRHGVPEDQVGMAILVHHSFPDEIELANGVGVLEMGTGSLSIEFVTQAGAVSVANPEVGVIPEEVSAWVSTSSGQIYPYLDQYSNLTPLGQTVMTWQDDYVALGRLLIQAAEQFQEDTGREPHQLDFEYKKIAPHGQLVVKQIREVPQPATEDPESRFLLGGSIDLTVFQGERADVIDSHRLKSVWQLTAESRWLTPENLDSCLYTDTSFEYHDQGQIFTASGSPASWPEASHEAMVGKPEEGFEVSDSWSFDHLANPRRYALTTSLEPYSLVSDGCPVLFLSDLTYELEARYAEPVLDWGLGGQTGTTTSDEATLVPCPPVSDDDILQIRKMADAGVTIETTFYWPPFPTGPVAGYTAPLIRWVETTITGLTTEPFTLMGDYSQTYEPGHHNFFEGFIFEPRLEPGLSKDTLDELQEKGIVLITVGASPTGQVTITTFAANGQ